MDRSLEAKTKPIIGVVLGSDSDLPILTPGLKMLEDWAIPFEVHILSAHRTPLAAADFGKSAEERGLKVLIAAAGMADRKSVV